MPMSCDQQAMKDAIQSKIINMMERVMDRVLVSDPFIVDKFRAEKPLYAALVPNEIFKGSHFERRFVTPFGSVWEDLAVTAAQYGLGKGEKGVSISGVIKQERLRRIAEVLNNLEHPEQGKSRVRPDWKAELDYVLKGKANSEKIPVNVMCDVIATDIQTDRKFAFEIKAPLPNSDQTKVSKEKILKLYAMEPRQVEGAYYALPYNPYGKKEDYAWSFPARWFNMREDEVVLIGNEFWEKVGGPGTYQAFVSAVNEIGNHYKERIYRDFLGIEPHSDTDRLV